MLKKLCQRIMCHSLIIYLCILWKCTSDNGMAICQLSCPLVSTLLFFRWWREWGHNARNSSHICLYPHCYFSVHEATDKKVNFQSMKQLARQFQKFYSTVYLNSKFYLLGGEATADTAPQSLPYSLSVSTLLFFQALRQLVTQCHKLPHSLLESTVIFRVVMQWSNWWQCHQLFPTVCPYQPCYFSGGEASDGSAISSSPQSVLTNIVLFQAVKQVMTVPSALPHSLSLPTFLLFRQWSDWWHIARNSSPQSILTNILIFQAVKRLMTQCQKLFPTVPSRSFNFDCPV